MKPRIKTQEGRDKYKLRQQTVERVFGIIKGVLGFRKFMLRGLDKAKLEWTLEPIVNPGGYLRNDGLRPTACFLHFCSVVRIGRFGRGWADTAHTTEDNQRNEEGPKSRQKYPVGRTGPGSSFCHDISVVNPPPLPRRVFVTLIPLPLHSRLQL